ncbi:GlxA family transcriptional regulator [Glycomyces buryatensis]|uniref:Helix-turn-helix domain-containing protein n=1 Tax=Glycomyces buryatensis TaxID=2570927 RepID=A0A4S8Q0P5_9ACTN|nr:DJ-1/PfpI family protein [Glycomyces buryatensis]THV33644.1 helix-turn-helix domain-containing protein [Glycomyces buryatensis]
MTEIVFLLVPRLHLLDLAGAAQVFSTATDLGLDYRLRYVADEEDVPTAQGVGLRAETAWPALEASDLVMVPGWSSPRTAGSPRLTRSQVDRLNEHHRRGGTVASVCSGAFALGQAGLLDGRRCTTHHDLQDALARRYPRATVVPDVLFTEDDGVVTSAGIASGIDLALHLAAVRHGPALAAKIARAMVVYARRNGGEPQSSAMLQHRSHLSDAVHRAQDLIEARFAEPLPLPDLADHSGVSQRTLSRLFADAIGMSPLQYQSRLRLERAEHLIARGNTVESAARAVGFGDARMLRRLRSRETA